MKRTRWCGELRKADAGKTVVLNGWVHRVRRFGRLVFILLRDRTGLVQVVVRKGSQAFDAAKKLQPEYVVAVKGSVRERPPKEVNPEMPTGEVEVVAEELQILSTSKPVPIPIHDESLMSTTSEAVRLRYRYLDLRRPKMFRNILMRAKIVAAMREYFDSLGFIEIETPYLARSTPEGARDFLVPSRLHPGKFYALTQSPQLFKQLLMIAGFERYYQVARCFRDEDPRADRQPEFTQFDVEMSFVTRDDVMEVVEGAMKHVMKKVFGEELETPFPRLTYWEAIRRYGSDKPDTRFGLELKDLEIGEGVARRYVVIEGGERIEEFLKAEALKASEEYGVRVDVVTGRDLNAYEAESGDVVVIAEGDYVSVSEALGKIRLAAASRLGLIDKNKRAFLWVIDFPLFEVDEETGRLAARHHPFTSPNPEDIHLLDEDPLRVRSLAYDLVLNGEEVAGGSIRIHDKELQMKILRMLGLSDEEAMNRYGFLLEALDYGAPPHGGIAFGLDRLVAVLLGEPTIREVIAFPKNKDMADPLTGAPAEAPEEYLKDLYWLQIRL